jgi:hypothetical protein
MGWSYQEIPKDYFSSPERKYSHIKRKFAANVNHSDYKDLFSLSFID